MSKIRYLSTLLLIPIFLSISLPAFAENFKDVKSGNDYFTAINYLREKNLINGYEDNSFKPKREVNRAEAIKLLSIATGLCENSPQEPTEKPFFDTPLEAWYTKYVAMAKSKGIINGYEDGTFHPEESITLVEALKMYFEAYEKAKGALDYSTGLETAFIDTAPDSWYSKYTSYAGANGLINIYDSNEINPEQKLTRGYLAEIIYRNLKLEEGYKFGKATYYQGIPGKNQDHFDLENMTTAHKTLPKGTLVEVTNLANGKSVVVKVTDRGPYGPGREIDLSKTAFSLIASPSTGIINVQYRIAEPEL